MAGEDSKDKEVIHCVVIVHKLFFFNFLHKKNIFPEVSDAKWWQKHRQKQSLLSYLVENNPILTSLYTTTRECSCFTNREMEFS